MTKPALSLLVVGFMVALLAEPSQAQTRLGDGFRAPPPSRQAPSPQPAQPQPQPLLPQGTPLDEASRAQAEQGAQGDYPVLERFGGGQIQEAWNQSKPTEGVYRVSACRWCVVKVRARELMVTTVLLPLGESIEAVDVGDQSGFEVQLRGARGLAIRPLLFGIDTNLNIYTSAGRVYPLYVRSEGFNSEHVPDVLVLLSSWDEPEVSLGTTQPTPPSAESTAEAPPFPDVSSIEDSAIRPQPIEPEAQDEFAQEIPFDPGKFHGWNQYRVYGEGDMPTPAIIWRDEYFTFIQWENRTPDLPVAYVVVDDIDETVNTRLAGETYIIESVAELISLKNGDSYLCLQFTGGAS